CEQRVDRGPHVGEPALDREVALRRPGAAERERAAGPPGFAGHAVAERLVGVPGARRPARTARESGQHEQCRDARRAVGPREVRTQAQSVGKELFHAVVILARVSASTTNATAPALKEWAAIVHALLEGEQIADV